MKRKGLNQMSPEHIEETKVNEIFSKTIREVTEDPKVKSLKADTLELVGEGTSLMERLGQMVETPWKV